jgi:hypothetical protein
VDRSGEIFDPRQDTVELEPVLDVDADANARVLGTVDLNVHVGHVDTFVKDDIPHVAQEKGAVVGMDVHAGQIRFARAPPFDSHQSALILLKLIEKDLAVAAMNLNYAL